MPRRRLDPLDLFVYAPVGAMIELRDDLDRWAGLGRSRIEEQVRTARGIGQFTVTQAERQLPGVLGGLQRLGERALADLGLIAEQPAADEPVDEDDLADVVELGAERVDEIPDPSSLSIEDYDSLSAVQVVPRLDGLGADELHAIGDYERATRGRRTILHRVEQLLEES